jgi:ABC transporter substrate binding protein (PQQ-dependent alcohol dehydrogenase system)
MERPTPMPCTRFGKRALITGVAVAVLGTTTRAVCADAATIGIGYIRWAQSRLTISLLDKPPRDDGLAGAKLAISDNNTTGRFVGQQFELSDAEVLAGADPVSTLAALAGRGITLMLTDVPGKLLPQLADAGRDKGVVLFNIKAPDDILRQQDCRSNLIHVAPSRAMLADALAQYLVGRKWSRWVLAYGSHPEDMSLADAYRRAAKRFGARIVKELEYKDTGGARQTDSGVVGIQKQMPVFTQGLPEYDVLVTADESEVFASYLPFRTWDARPVVGSAGLRPVGWDPSSESWGGTQLQDRFVRMAHRQMTPLDMQAWTAVRMVGEAASRTNSGDAKAILSFLKGADFSVAAFKGQRLTLRDWNLQLRQPILLVDGRMVVSVSPQEGFLHQVSELDTLGVDRPETKCKLH